MDFHRVYWAGPKRENYMQKAQAIAPANLIALWPLSELSGTTAFDQSGNGRNAAYVNSPTLGQTGIGDGGTAPLFVPASNTYVNTYSVSMANAFNGQEGTFAIWFKVRAASVWTDAANRCLMLIAVNGSNLLTLRKTTTNNQLLWQLTAGGTSKTANITYSATTWTHLAISWSKSGNAIKVYVNGTQSGATVTGIGTWSGTPIDGNCFLGAQADNFALWDGYEALGGLWSTPLSDAQILSLATVP